MVSRSHTLTLTGVSVWLRETRGGAVRRGERFPVGCTLASYIEACIKFLHSLYNFCFQKGVVPGTWSRTIIKPIPKAKAGSQFPGARRTLHDTEIGMQR